MRNVRSLLFSFIVAVLSFAPLLVQAQTSLVPRSSDTSGRSDYAFYNLCTFGQLIQNIINYAIIFSIPLVAVLVGYAGFLYFTSGANPGNISKARQIFATALIGFLVAISGWLIVNTILHALFSGGAYFKEGEWFSIQCSGSRLGVDKPINVSDWLSPNPAITPGGLTSVPSPSFGGSFSDFSDVNLGYPVNSNIPPGDIAAAAAAYYRADTSYGPDGGNLACVWAVNNVLQSTGIDPLDGNTVAGMEQVLTAGGRGTLAADTAVSGDLSNTSKGDIVVWKDYTYNTYSHVGVCLDNGCNQVISNTSGKASFSTVTNANYNSNWQARIYRVNQ